MTTQNVIRQGAPQGKGWGWFPWAIVGSLVAVFAVNGALLYFAKSTFPGIAATKPYEVGAAYNSVLANAARQEALGWKLTTTTVSGHVIVQLLDQAGRPLDQLTITGSITRPVGGEAVYPLSFAFGADGVYRSAEAVPAPGQWDLKLAARNGEAVAYTAARRLIAP